MVLRKIVLPSGQEDHPFLGDWRITAIELWDREYLDMEVPAFLRFGDNLMGEFQFGLVRG